MADEKMPFTEHLTELRKRIIISLLALLCVFVVAFNYSEQLLGILMLPLRIKISFITSYPFMVFTHSDLFKKIHEFQALGVAEPFMVNIKIAFVASLIITLPIIFYQLWKFIAPGLSVREKKYVVPFVLVSTLLFVAGALFCFFLVLPFALDFLLTYKTRFIRPNPTATYYFDFCLKFILAFGAIFELPMIIVFLTRIGIVTPKMLSKNRKYAVLLAFVVAAVLTPTPDWFNQTLMAAPIIVLYETGIIVSRLFVRKKTGNA